MSLLFRVPKKENKNSRKDAIRVYLLRLRDRAAALEAKIGHQQVEIDILRGRIESLERDRCQTPQ
jgi:hypothetical protein